jgi:hypothetical protein
VIVAVNLNDFDRAPHLNGLGVLSTDDGDRESAWSPGNWSELYLAYRWIALLARGDPRLAGIERLQPLRRRVGGRGSRRCCDRRGGRAGGGAGDTAAAPAPSPTAAWHVFDRYVSNLRKRFYRAPTEPEWSALERAWRDLATRAPRARQPSRVRPLPRRRPDRRRRPRPDAAESALELCAANGFECLDLTPAFRAAAPGVALHSDIMHPNDAGHALAARSVAEYLRR